MICNSCNGTGWYNIKMFVVALQRKDYVWFACADCNDGESKPKVCELCTTI
jgi:hypothetical protein